MLLTFLSLLLSSWIFHLLLQCYHYYCYFHVDVVNVITSFSLFLTLMLMLLLMCSTVTSVDTTTIFCCCWHGHLHQMFNRWSRNDRKFFVTNNLSKCCFAVSQHDFPFWGSPNICRILRTFSENSCDLIYPPCPTPCHLHTPNNQNCEFNQNFKFSFLKTCVLITFLCLFPTPFTYCCCRYK